MKRFLVVLASVLCLALMADCGGGAEQAKNDKVLKVGMDANFPPFEYYQKGTDVYTGFDVELMQGVAHEMGYGKVEFVNTGLKDLVAGLNEGKYNVIASGFSVTPEREQQVDFSEPYLNDGFRVAIPAGSNISGGIEVLAGRRVAVKNNSFALNMVNEFGGAGQIIETASIEEAINKVIDGEADCTVISKSAGAFFIANGYGDKIKFAGSDLAGDKVALAVKKGNTEFLNTLNGSLREFRKSQSFDQLKKTYFGEF